jgi:hypothetical protein
MSVGYASDERPEAQIAIIATKVTRDAASTVLFRNK